MRQLPKRGGVFKDLMADENKVGGDGEDFEGSGDGLANEGVASMLVGFPS